MSAKGRVVVAMSGGVDSSVAAALLVEQGYEVIGMMLRLWNEPGAEQYNRCCTPDAMALARRVAARLGIPFYAVDTQQPFYDHVVTYFLQGYAQGATPNPCLVCNRQIRWTFLLERAISLGADFMATGHYARVRQTPEGTFELLRGIDEAKDQSYVLHVMDQQRLARALFPLGDYTKPRVRELAQRFDLPVTSRAESQDLCFLGDGNYRDFLMRHVPEIEQSGPIHSRTGKLLGEHRGLAYYTIGQRKGLGISSPVPLYVLEKDVHRNVLIVGTEEELGNSELVTGPVNWIAGQAPKLSLRTQVKIRYKAHLAWGKVTPQPNGGMHIRFDAPLRDITPGQAAVVYDGERVLGGGVIIKENEI